jgi:predicted NAD-dependent protein-ADP-ribosyltransferase YbiA (DUF1768 family)
MKWDIVREALFVSLGAFQQKKKLLDTGNAKLINTNTYRDEYYGLYLGKGRNKLGVALMRLRDELKG